jgi:hypothetical protein
LKATLASLERFYSARIQVNDLVLSEMYLLKIFELQVNILCGFLFLRFSSPPSLTAGKAGNHLFISTTYGTLPITVAHKQNIEFLRICSQR